MMRSVSFHLVAMAILTSLLVPVLALAQNQEDELHATIRSVLLADPRTSSLTEVQLNAIVNALADGAQKQGVTAGDITWRPQETDTFGESGGYGACGSLPVFLCALNEAFGFDGSSFFFPVAFGATSAFLLFVIGMLLHRLGHHPTGRFIQM